LATWLSSVGAPPESYRDIYLELARLVYNHYSASLPAESSPGLVWPLPVVATVNPLDFEIDIEDDPTGISPDEILSEGRRASDDGRTFYYSEALPRSAAEASQVERVAEKKARLLPLFDRVHRELLKKVQAVMADTKYAELRFPAIVNIGSQSFLFTHRIGAGGMGEVFYGVAVATNELADGGSLPTGFQVVMKMILKDLAGQKEHQVRWGREGTMGPLGQHDGFATVINFGKVESEDPQVNGKEVIIFPYLYGADLDEVMNYLEENGQSFTLAQALFLASYYCEVEHFLLFVQQISHRDEKPGNIRLLWTKRGAFPFKLCDFGLVKAEPVAEEEVEEDGPTEAPVFADPAEIMLVEKDEGKTLPGQIVGTPMYLPPEHFYGQSVSGLRRAQYALAVMLIEMLVGRYGEDVKSMTQDNLLRFCVTRELTQEQKLRLSKLDTRSSFDLIEELLDRDSTTTYPTMLCVQEKVLELLLLTQS